MKGLTILSGVLLLSIVISGCRLLGRKKRGAVEEDVFYTDSGGLLGRPRIPLIKPYELLRESENEWHMDLHTPVFALAVDNVNGINVSNGKILIHSKGISGTQIRFGEVVKDCGEAWFIIDPFKHEEKAFVRNNEYKKALAFLGVTDTALLSPMPLYESFCSSAKLEWQPQKGRLFASGLFARLFI